jgi:hypothetical protein
MRRAALSVPGNIAEGYEGCIDRELFQDLKRDIGEGKRVMKALIESLENKHFNP